MRKRLYELYQQLKHENATPRQLGWSVAAGLFLGIVPLYGIQTGLVLFTAWAFRLNKLACLFAAQISMPWFAPFLIAIEIALGEWMRFGTLRWPGSTPDTLPSITSWSDAPDVVISCLFGSLPLGIVLGGSAGLLTYWYARGDMGASSELS